MRYSILFIFLFILTLCGCATLNAAQKNPHGFYRVNRQAELSKIKLWNIRGALSIQSQNEHATLASYQWQQRGKNNYRIQISSVLGLYQIIIVGNNHRVTLWKKSQAISAQSPEQLLQQTMGWSLPISNLYYWIRGIPAPGHYLAKYDAYHHLINLQQQAWYLQYINYTNVNGLDLPNIIILQRPGLRIKIVIKKWAA